MASFNHNIVITVDSKKAATNLKAVEKNAKQAGKETEKFGKDAKQAGTKVEKLGKNAEFTGKKVEKFGKKAKKAGKEAETSFSKLTKKANLLRLGIGGVAIAIGVKFVNAIVRAADTLKLAEARIGLFTESALAAEVQMQRLVDISNSTFTTISENANLFARFAQATEDMGTSARDVTKIVEALNLSFIVSGSTGAEAASVALQLSQAFGAGVLRGDEFRSVQEGNLTLLKLLAKALKVEVGSLKQLATQGVITADVIERALTNNVQVLRDQVEQLPVTTERALKVAATAWDLFAASVDETLGLSVAYVGVLKGFTDGLNALSGAADIELFPDLESAQIGLEAAAAAFLIADKNNKAFAAVALGTGANVSFAAKAVEVARRQVL